MKSPEEQERRKTTRFRLRPGSFLALLLWFRAAQRRADRDRPQIVSTNAAAASVLDRAKQLANDKRQDIQAVEELISLANHKQRTLRQAEKASRYLGYHREIWQANLTNRLLKAALARHSVSDVASGDRERIDNVEAFNRLPRSEQWDHLTRLQPRLLDLDREVNDGRFGEIRAIHGRSDQDTVGRMANTGSQSLATQMPDSEIRQIRKAAQMHNRLVRQLQVVIGPYCDIDDLLLTSQRAFDVARICLLAPPMAR
jgi:hypothetical protein